MDKLKGYLIGGLIGGAILGGVLLFFNAAGSLAWLWCWLFTVLITLGVQYIAPTWILPLFNKFTPLEDGELKEKLNSSRLKNGLNFRYFHD